MVRLRRVVDACDDFDREAFSVWARDNGLDPNRVYRVEFYPLRFVRVHQYALDETGRKYVVEGDAATDRPYVVRTRTPVPV